MSLPEEVLVADDDDFVRSVLAQQLQALGIPFVHQAAEWRIAAALLRTHPGCNLVVSDLDMPGVRGTDFLVELAALRPGAELIISSSMPLPVLRSAEKQARTLKLRALGVLPKPYNKAALLALLNTSSCNSSQPELLA